jgi:RimJ/RimL family protein N-acetyltransferase/ketosteroid isomerase-like protein
VKGGFVPTRGLPGNANLEQLKKGAKSFQRAVRAGDAGAAEVVGEFHPRLTDAQPGSPELERFTRADAQLVIARQFGFAGWPKLKAHLELVSRYARSPHEQPVGGPLADAEAVVDEFLKLACLTYGDDEPERLSRARDLLDQHNWLARASIHTIAATGDVTAAAELLDRDPGQASLVGGPHGWEPLLYLTYARVPLGPGRSAVGVARLLLEHGANPNAGYLWEGLIPPFTALTGALGGGGRIPRHPEELALARLLLEAGADANDGQALYNRGWGPDPQEDWLELLFEFGLGTGDGGPWRRLLGERQDSPRKMVEDLLIAAAGHGLTDRVRRLLARGVDPEGREPKHPIYQGRTPVQEAALAGHMDVVAVLVDAGASWEHDQVDELIATAMSGDRAAVEQLLAADPDLRGRAIERCPDQLVRAAGQNNYDAVELLIELGFDVNARSRTAPLHEAAMLGNLAVIRLLVDHGADPNIHDTGYDATPAGWAEHHGQREAQLLLEALEQAAPATPSIEAGAPTATQPGAAMRTVAAAFTAVSEARFTELGSMLASEIDWRGLADEDGHIPRCRGRAEALERMRIGLLANGQVSVSEFVEEGDRVLARVHATGDDQPRPSERFVVAEVHDGQISQLRGYATEREARHALRGGSLNAPPEPGPQRAPAARLPQAPSGSERTPAPIELRPLTGADLPVIAPWFEDPDTRRFLGGPDWPAAILAHNVRSVATTFRGAAQTGAYRYLALADGTPVGYIDCGTFDRCTVYAGEGPDGPLITETIDAPTGSIAFAINPERRGRGLGRAMIAALLARPELQAVELFEAGVEPENIASRRCLEAAGFRLRSQEPDFEGMLYYRVWRAEVSGRSVTST